MGEFEFGYYFVDELFDVWGFVVSYGHKFLFWGRWDKKCF